MYATLITKINTILGNVSSVQQVFNYPSPTPTKNPYVVFYPDVTNNEFETTRENQKEYNFKIWVNVAVKQKSIEFVWGTVLPAVVDDVIAEFDENWSGQTGNHRISYLIDSGLWGMSEENKSLEAFAELNLRVRVLTDL